MGNVPLNQRMAAIFNFNTSDIIKYPVIANVNVITHAHINGGVFDAAKHVVFDQSVFTEFRENAVHPRINDPVVAYRKVVTGLPHNGIAFVIGYFEPLHSKAITRIQDGVVKLLIALKIGPLAVFHHATQGNVVFVYVNGFSVQARVHLNNVSGACCFDSRLNRIALTDIVNGGITVAHNARQEKTQRLEAAMGENRLRTG